jgi:hypothetical protein
MDTHFGTDRQTSAHALVSLFLISWCHRFGQVSLSRQVHSAQPLWAGLLQVQGPAVTVNMS